MTFNMKLNEARKEGRAEGKAEGRAEGKAEGTMETLLALIQMGKLSVADAAAFASMSVSAFEEYMDKQRKSEEMEKTTGDSS